MRIISLHLLGFAVLAAATLHGQTFYVTGPNASSLDCTGVEGPVQIYDTSGTTLLGYSCEVSGAFIWYAAGGAWSTSIRVAAPASAPIGVEYTFLDLDGNLLSLDTTSGAGSATTSTNDLGIFGLNANQPAEVDLLGATGAGPNYPLQDGSVYAQFYCPDPTTCALVLPQLIYSALPAVPYSLSVPIAWDGSEYTQWSAEGLDDGGTHTVSLAIYNADTTPATYTIQVYDGNGNLAGTATTQSIPVQNPSNYGQGGVRATELRNLISPLPSGIFKVFITGPYYSDVEVLQFTGPSATTLQVAYDASPGLSIGAIPARHPAARKARVGSAQKRVLMARPK